MAPNYTVVQGDHAASIAHKAGLPGYKVLWDDGANAALKEQRKNPNVLFPGDKVVIPEHAPKEESAATDKRHTFQRELTKLKLRLRILSEPGKPVSSVECRLTVDNVEKKLPTDGKGIVETPILPDSREGRLIVDDPKHFLSINSTLGIGELDPVDTVSGQIGRLNNLGYFAGKPEEPADDLAKLRFRSAVEEFQLDHALTVDGKCGPNTQDKLKKEHGC